MLLVLLLSNLHFWTFLSLSLNLLLFTALLFVIDYTKLELNYFWSLYAFWIYAGIPCRDLRKETFSKCISLVWPNSPMCLLHLPCLLRTCSEIWWDASFDPMLQCSGWDLSECFLLTDLWYIHLEGGRAPFPGRGPSLVVLPSLFHLPLSAPELQSTLQAHGFGSTLVWVHSSLMNTIFYHHRC